MDKIEHIRHALSDFDYTGDLDDVLDELQTELARPRMHQPHLRRLRPAPYV